jgi:hypothetical protein
VVAGGSVLSEDWATPLMNRSFNFLRIVPGGANLTQEQLSKIVRLSGNLTHGVQSVGIMLAVGKKDESLCSNILLVIRANNAKTYLQRCEESIGEMAAIGKEASSPTPSLCQVERLEIEGSTGLKLSIHKSALMANQVPRLQATELMDMVFGEGSNLDVYMAVADENTILGVCADGLVEAIKTLKQGEGQLADDDGIAKTLAMLSQGSQCVGFWSPAWTLQQLSFGDSTPPEIRELPPIGFAVKLSAASVDTDLAAPAETLEFLASCMAAAAASFHD